MELDILLYKITKPNLDTNKTYNPNLLDDLLGMSFHSVENNKTQELVPSHMMDNLTQIVNINCTYFDNRLLFKKIQKAYPDLYPGAVEDYFKNAVKTKNDAPREVLILTAGSIYASDEISYVFEDYYCKDANGEPPHIRVSANC